ncbi:amidohydrolase family protein [Bradyrhizobium tropiciagri]|uniref:amidohydrolase family protein n=1 Tax=Bradyrhizobium tropiciagri TaxID=312253 RepID=UPI00067BD853|nr:amidohydrolase family protein [Bradyrhizobium tropiciagri]
MSDADTHIETPTTRFARRHDVQEITIHTDTREILANASKDIARLGLDKYFIVDVDAHHVELDSWAEILTHIEDPVIRYNAQAIAKNWPYAANLAMSSHAPGLTMQDAGGRIPHQAQLAEHVPILEGEHRDLTLVRRAMQAMKIDVQVVFPQPMLGIGMHPSAQAETQLVTAYNRWFVSRVLSRDSRIKSMLALPFRDPEASLRTVLEFADAPGVVGFLVTSQRQTQVSSRGYMRLYAELEERGLPLGFHAGPDYMMERAVNRFVSVHALSFVTCNMIHLTNWVMNGLPERFPKLKVIWIESGLAWLPFMMQRLDHEWLLRQSDAPLLKRLPSDYIKEMFYTSQPLEATNMELLEATFRAINADTQLLYSSDWPHWDFDPPARIASLPFLSERARRNILGENAAQLFKLKPARSENGS